MHGQVTNYESATKPLVLLIDDSPDVHRLLDARLRSEHLTLISAHDGQSGLEIVRAVKPATILLDLEMPNLSGFDVLRALKDNHATHNIPVIVLTGRDQSTDKVMAFDLGATDYITKPFDLAELRARLRSTLRLDRLLDMLARRAAIDGLTGLHNRAYFDSRLSQEVSECNRYGNSLSLALIDIDHFKSINDTFGHPAGDEVLIGMAEMVRREVRSSDSACRYGGEEFALILPQTDTELASTLAERIRRRLEREVWPKHPETPVTCSIGVVGCRQANEPLTAEQWIETADRNLYAAKAAGRNRIVTSNLGERESLSRSA